MFLSLHHSTHLLDWSVLTVIDWAELYQEKCATYVYYRTIVFGNSRLLRPLWRINLRQWHINRINFNYNLWKVKFGPWENRSVVALFTSHPEGQSSVSWRRGPEAQVQEQSRSQVSISSSLEEGRDRDLWRRFRASSRKGHLNPWGWKCPRFRGTSVAGPIIVNVKILKGGQRRWEPETELNE